MNGRKLTRREKRMLAALLVAIAGVMWGVMLLSLNLGQGLRRASYDLPFRFTERQAPDDIVLVYLDEATFVDLQQPTTVPLDRRIHAALVKRLTEAGARMIIFDILFHDPRPEEDADFAKAIADHGKVVLIGELVRNTSESADREALLLAVPDLRREVAGWGLATVPRDTDDVIRRVRPMVETPFGEKPSLSERVRQLESGDESPESSEVWMLDYYGRAGTFAGYSYSGVLLGAGIPEDAFRDKIVIVGAKQNADTFDVGKDVFATPYSPVPVPVKDPVTGELKRKLMLTPGMEIQATAIANLLEGRRILPLGPRFEGSLIVLSALVLSAAAFLMSPVRGGILCVLLGGGIALGGILAQQMLGWQLPWAIPAIGQMPLILGLALMAHYLIEYSARWKLRRAFKSYMSDEQARQIDEDDVTLELGGKEVEATILFSDLAGFMSMSEGLPPQSVSKALISYFESATEGILDNDGTIIKYIGDSVMATWGAPLKVDREADRAIEAAIQMQVASTKPVTLETADGSREQVLETRVGINSGVGLAGNLGSSRRFDYSVIGDTTNTAARLEGLNKMLGTSILVSEAVLEKCEDRGRFVSREMGAFVLMGRRRSIVVHEILGLSECGPMIRKRSESYLEDYSRALAAFRAGDFSLAWTSFESALGHHDRAAEDPASALFLKALEGRDLRWIGRAKSCWTQSEPVMVEYRTRFRT